MRGLDVTDSRIISCLASSPQLDSTKIPLLLENLPGLNPRDISVLLKSLEPSLTVNYTSLFNRILLLWVTRDGDNANPMRLSQLLRSSLNLPRLAERINEQIVPSFLENNPSRKWIFDTASVLAQEETLTTGNGWKDLMCYLGLEQDISSLDPMRLKSQDSADFEGGNNLVQFWSVVMERYKGRTPPEFDKIEGLQMALVKTGLIDHSREIQGILQMTSR